MKEKIEKVLNTAIKLTLVFLIILLSGCNKKELDTKDFIKLMENKKYSTVELSKNKQALAVGNHFHIYFNYFSSKNSKDKSIKKALKEYNSKDIHKTNNKNVTIYEIEKNNIYSVYAIKDKSYIEITSINSYKKEIKGILKYLDYS